MPKIVKNNVELVSALPSAVIVKDVGGNVNYIRGDFSVFSNYPQVTATRGVNFSTPVQIGNKNNWSKISSYNQNTSMGGIDTDGNLYIWGNNSYGSLGVNDLTFRPSPVQLGETSFWQSMNGLDTSPIACGYGITFAIDRNGRLWGAGGYVSLGLNLGIGSFNVSSLTQLGNQQWKHVSTNQRTVAVIQTNGTLWMWGNNLNGALGTSDVTARTSPVQIGNQLWKIIATQEFSTLGIQSNGTLWGWGRNSSGQLGLSDTTDRLSPVQIGTSSWKEISSANGATIGIQSNGTLWGWGSNFFYSLGLGDQTNRSLPVQIGSNLWKKVAVGNNGTLAIQSNGTLWAWGNNTEGQLGVGDLAERTTPVQVGTSLWKEITAQLFSSFGIQTDGTLWGWGLNSSFFSLIQPLGNFTGSNLPGLVTYGF